MVDGQCHCRQIDDVVSELQTHIHKGLSSREANDRLRTNGPNELTERPRPRFFKLLLD